MAMEWIGSQSVHVYAAKMSSLGLCLLFVCVYTLHVVVGVVVVVVGGGGGGGGGGQNLPG